MSLRIGDTVFNREGQPAAIKGRDEVTEKLDLSVKKEDLDHSIRHGYINGLSEENRTAFNGLMDSFKEIEDVTERTMKMRERLTDLEADPRQHRLAQYVRAEMLHLMHTYNIKPKEFTAPMARLDK